MRKGRIVKCVVICALLGALTPLSSQWWPKHVIAHLNDPSIACPAHMNNDSLIDVVAIGNTSPGVIVCYLAPFWTADTVASNLIFPYFVRVGDMDNDNDNDIIANSYPQNDILGYVAPFWNMVIIDDNLLGATNLHLVDIDYDSDLDVIATAEFGGVVWYENPSWYKHPVDTLLNGAWGLCVGDMDNDNDSDIVAAGYHAGVVVWYEAPSWIPHTIDTGLDSVVGVCNGDIDNDGDRDLVVTLPNGNSIFWYEAPSWTQHCIDSTLPGAFCACVCDIDDDNDLDVVAAGRGDPHGLFVWYENISLAWTPHIIEEFLGEPYHVCIADVDNDNDLDVVATENDQDQIMWYENTVVGIYDEPVVKHIDDTVFSGATIQHGSLILPEGKKCRVFDISGRLVEPSNITHGIYFIEIEGEISTKIIKLR